MTDVDIRAQIVREALTWEGTPYRHLGAVKGAGVDCAMILCGVYCGLGLTPDFDPRPYPRDWMMHHDEERYLAGIKSRAREISKTEVQQGDFAIYRFGRTFSHSAIVLKWPEVLHASVYDGFVVRADAAKFPFVGREVKFFTVL